VADCVLLKTEHDEFFLLYMMTDQELIGYFETKDLPETLRIDRATTQTEVKEAVERNIGSMLKVPNDGRAKHRLIQILNALENPYDGPEIPLR